MHWKPNIDRSLLAHLDKNQEWLRSHFAKFMKRYQAYLTLLEEVDKHVDKLSKYFVLHSLERDTEQKFIELYQLLKLWEINNAAKALPMREINLALQNALSIDKAILLFNDYYKALKANAFATSLNFKGNAFELSADSPSKTHMQEFLANCQMETHTLGASITHYREFLLRSDPNPYVRTRVGFSEGTVDSEPAHTKPLLNLGYDVETLSEIYEKLTQALKKAAQKRDRVQIDAEIQRLLREMEQPLATHRMMRTSAEALLEHLQQLDELGSFDYDMIPYVGKILSKLLRADWRYHVLFGIPLFHQLYAIHTGLTKPVEDWQHVNRLKKFQKLLRQIQDWVKSQKTQAHFYDIELDMNDIKGYLQDFFAHVQRLALDSSVKKEAAQAQHDELVQELLEYRYLFGNFFYQLRQNESEGLRIRRQFLFVDQYFESVENKLYEMQLNIDTIPEEQEENSEDQSHESEDDSR